MKFNQGGKVHGPSHDNGGVPAIQNGQVTAEVEGGERIFSTKDTAEIEEMAGRIMTAENQGDADAIALSLGHSVAKMVQRQEENKIPDEEFLNLGSDAGDIPDDTPDLIIE